MLEAWVEAEHADPAAARAAETAQGGAQAESRCMTASATSKFAYTFCTSS